MFISKDVNVKSVIIIMILLQKLLIQSFVLDRSNLFYLIRPIVELCDLLVLKRLCKLTLLFRI